MLRRWQCSQRWNLLRELIKFIHHGLLFGSFFFALDPNFFFIKDDISTNRQFFSQWVIELIHLLIISNEDAFLTAITKFLHFNFRYLSICNTSKNSQVCYTRLITISCLLRCLVLHHLCWALIKRACTGSAPNCSNSLFSFNMVLVILRMIQVFLSATLFCYGVQPVVNYLFKPCSLQYS